MSQSKRRHQRQKMVLPLKVWSKDASDKPFNAFAHTLDITPIGARLGAIRHLLKKGETLTVQYRQRRFQVRVVWIQLLEGTSEYQVGVEAIASGETWGLELTPSQKEETAIVQS